MNLDSTLARMAATYRRDPQAAVRGQTFIKLLHDYLGDEFDRRLSPGARRRGVAIVKEATLYGSHKPKDVDLVLADPANGPLVIVGIRSQMSSVGKNALNYYEGIIGECISLQDRFPRAVIGYVYLMPVRAIKAGREAELINHGRYAEMYAKITGRSGQDYANIRGIYDHFAYMVVDFSTDPPAVRDDLVDGHGRGADLRIETFTERMIATFKEREIFIDLFV